MKNQVLVAGVLLTASVLFLAGCASSSSDRSNTYKTEDQGRPLVDSKYSLTADRKALAEARSQVPEDIKVSNDELALSLQLMTENKKKPNEVRAEFDKLVRQKRTLFDKDLKKERETFTLEERKKRDEFLKVQKDTRNQFMKNKNSREALAEFYKDQDSKRKEYFADERERRNDFESDMRERRKSFEDYTRGKVNEFNQEHRAYLKRFEEAKKENKASAISEEKLLNDELNAIKSKPATPLGSGE